MKGRVKACISVAGSQLQLLAKPDVENFKVSYAGSISLFVVGTAAILGNATYTGYAAYILATSMFVIGSRQYYGFFKSQPVINQPDEESEYHSTEELKTKKFD